MSSICFEPEGSSSGRRYVPVWYSVLYVYQYKQSFSWKSVFYYIYYFYP